MSDTKGVERITEKGIVANGVEYEVDCIIFASGFEITTRARAAGSASSRSPAATACRSTTTGRDGYRTLHGMMSHGFPNQFFTGFIQGGVTASTTAMFEQQADHIAYIITEALRARRDDRRAHRGGPGGLGPDHPGRRRSTTRTFAARMHARLLQQRGRSDDGSGRSSASRTGPGFYAHRGLLEAWRGTGEMEGLELRK